MWENLREHYELTLRAWVEGLKRSCYGVLRKQVVGDDVPDVVACIWLGCAAAFRPRRYRGSTRCLLSRAGWRPKAACRSHARNLYSRAQS